MNVAITPCPAAFLASSWQRALARPRAGIPPGPVRKVPIAVPPVQGSASTTGPPRRGTPVRPLAGVAMGPVCRLALARPPLERGAPGTLAPGVRIERGTPASPNTSPLLGGAAAAKVPPHCMVCAGLGLTRFCRGCGLLGAFLCSHLISYLWGRCILCTTQMHHRCLDLGFDRSMLAVCWNRAPPCCLFPWPPVCWPAAFAGFTSLPCHTWCKHTRVTTPPSAHQGRPKLPLGTLILHEFSYRPQLLRIGKVVHCMCRGIHLVQEQMTPLGLWRKAELVAAYPPPSAGAEEDL